MLVASQMTLRIQTTVSTCQPFDCTGIVRDICCQLGFIMAGRGHVGKYYSNGGCSRFYRNFTCRLQVVLSN